MIALPSRHTVYQALLGLRKQLATSISNESQVLTSLEDLIDESVDTSELSDVVCSFTDGLNDVRRSIKYTSATGKLIHIKQNLSTQVIDDVEYDISELRGGDVDPFLDSVSSLTANSDANEAIATINDLFLSHNKVDISVITASLQDYSNTNVKEYGTIISSLSALTDSSGAITQLSWVQWCKRTFSIGLNAGDNQSFQLDDTDPYKLIDFINIMQSAFNVLSNVLFNAIAAAFRGLLGLFAIIFSTMISMWNAAKEKFGEVQIKDEELLWHIAGGVFQTSETGYLDGTRLDGLCHYLCLPGLDCYWWVDASTHTLQSQCFATVNIHPDRLYDYLLLVTSSQDTASYIQINSNHFMLEDEDETTSQIYEAYENIFLKEEDYATLSVDGDFLRRAIAASLCAIGLRCASTGQWNCGGGVSTYTPQFDFTVPGYQPWKMIAQIAAVAFAEFKYKKVVNNAYSMFSDITWNMCFNIHNYFFKNTTDNTINYILNTDSVWVSEVAQAQAAHVYKSPIHGLITYHSLGGFINSVDPLYISDESNSLDYFPVSPKVVLPQLNFDAILAWMIIAGIAITATIVTTKLLLRTRRIARTVKRQRAADELQAKYNKAVATGDIDDIKDFVKAQKRFDLKAKIFKWDAYDCQNQWWETRNTASSLGALINGKTATTLATGVSTVYSKVVDAPSDFQSIKTYNSWIFDKVQNMPLMLNSINAGVGTCSTHILRVDGKIDRVKKLIDGE